MGALPTRDDLFRTITCGLQGSSMPDFRLVSDPERHDVVEYVLHVAAFGLVRQEAGYLIAEEGRTLAELRGEELERIYDEVVAEKITRAKRVAVPTPPDRTADLVAAGEKVFDLQCAACHGKTGKGDGASARTLRDWKGSVIVPRDFTSGVFRAGSETRDIFKRMRTGLTGTPMPAIGASDDELWALTFYMETLIDPDAEKPELPAGCGGEVQR